MTDSACSGITASPKEKSCSAGRVRLRPDAGLHRARHMDPQASNTRDQHAAGCLVGRRSSGREFFQWRTAVKMFLLKKPVLWNVS